MPGSVSDSYDGTAIRAVLVAACSQAVPPKQHRHAAATNAAGLSRTPVVRIKNKENRMPVLLSYHNDKSIKRKYLARVRAHAKADKIVKGHYWEGGRGCAVGCTIHSGNHSAYQDELGLPEWLARLEDALFEGLPNGQAKSFPAKFLAAVPVGKNLEAVKWRFSLFLLAENAARVEKLNLDGPLKAQVLAAIEQVEKASRRAVESGKWNESAARSAESAARSARNEMQIQRDDLLAVLRSL